jgi:hypothetical protein
MLLVTYWRSDRSGGIAPGDCVVAAPRFPADEEDCYAVALSSSVAISIACGAPSLMGDFWAKHPELVRFLPGAMC